MEGEDEGGDEGGELLQIPTPHRETSAHCGC